MKANQRIVLASVFALSAVFGNLFSIAAISAGEPSTDKSATEFRARVSASATAGAKWLANSTLSNGEFQYGWIPSLNRPMNGNNDLRQAGAALALARAARVLKDPQLEIAGRQALLRLVESRTTPVHTHFLGRQPDLQKTDSNQVGMAGLLLAGICELPTPDEKSAKYMQELSRFLVSRQREDGSLFFGVGEDDEADDLIAIDFYPGEGLFGLVLTKGLIRESNQRCVAKALPFYREHFQKNPSLAFVPWQVQTFTEMYARTNERKYADFVFEMADYILQFQYSPQAQAEWRGGFGDCDAGVAVMTPPGASTGSFAETLVPAYKAAKKAGDRAREKKYKAALDNSLEFLLRLQYTREHRHFSPEYLAKIEGAFFASVEDGAVRIDFTQHAICAMLSYLEITQPAASLSDPAKLSTAKFRAVKSNE